MQQQQQQLDAAALQQLQVLLKAELGREMASGLIARDDTLAELKKNKHKKDKQQRRRWGRLRLQCVLEVGWLGVQNGF